MGVSSFDSRACLHQDMNFPVYKLLVRGLYNLDINLGSTYVSYMAIGAKGTEQVHINSLQVEDTSKQFHFTSM